MARSQVHSVTPMTDGNVADDTEIRHRVFSDDYVKQAVARWASFDAGNAAWRIANPGQSDPPHAAAVDVDNPTVPEKIFVEVRMKLTNDVDSSVKAENSEWRQANATNYVGLTGHSANLKIINDTEVTRKGLDPV